MTSLFCCFCVKRRRKRMSVDDSNNVSLAGSPMHDLLEHPQALSQQLEDKIAAWQKTIFEYENMELEFLMRNPSSDRSMLVTLREQPARFLNDANDVIKALAVKRTNVNQLEKQLASKRKGELPQPHPLGGEEVADSSSSGQQAKDADLDKFEADGAPMGYFTERLSQIWTHRLNSIDPTQGALSLLRSPVPVVPAEASSAPSSASSKKSSELLVRPKWPDFLTDVSFDVVKVNKYGHQMRRVLKLTPNHVISIKNGNEVTKFYHYLDIRRVGLRRGNRVYVLLRSGKRNLYVSPIAPHILQQITTRVQVRRSLDRAFLGGQLEGYDGLGYDVESAAELIKAISEENTSDTDAVMAHFATTLRERTIRSLSVDETRSPLPSASTDRPAASQPLPTPEEVQDEERAIAAAALREVVNAVCGDTPSPSPPPPLPLPLPEQASPRSALHRDLEGGSRKSVSRVPMLMTFPEGTPEHVVQEAVRTVIFDGSTAEGNTRNVFVERFRADTAVKAAAALALDIRHFIDGMHEHMVSSRAFSLAISYQQHLQKALAGPQAAAVSVLSPAPRRLELSATAKSAGGDAQQKFKRRASLKVLLESNLGPADVDEALLTVISYIIFVVVEEATFLSLKEHIIALVKQDKGYDEESTVVQKLKYFVNRSQAQWGIAPDLVSPLGWRSASFELASIEHNLTPTFQLQVLTRTMKAIYSEFKFAVLPRMQALGKGNNVFLGADDLVPIFLFVFCQSNLRHPVRNRDLMWALCHPDQLHGEAGYYLTVYESAIDCVLRENIEHDSFITCPEEVADAGPQRPSSVSAPAQRKKSAEYVSFSSYFAGFFKMSGVVEEEDHSLSMRESFA